jgi:hypothetical protein
LVTKRGSMDAPCGANGFTRRALRNDFAALRSVIGWSKASAIRLRDLPASACVLGVDSTQPAFPRPVATEQNVKFWVDVFAIYSERDFIVHDHDQVDRVYHVIYLPGDGDRSSRERAMNREARR